MEQNNIYKTVFKVTHSGGSGSCFYLKAYDLFVTNYHVTEGFRTVAIHDNERNPYLAKVVLANPAMDIALLAAEGDFSSLPDISLAEDDTLTIGRKVYVAGYPYGMPFTITEGSVSSPKQLMDGKYYIQTDAAVNPGNSGGPILNDAEEVVGVTVSKFTQADNMGFGIRVETLHGLLESLGELDRTAFQVQCGSCEELICEEEEFCPSCGDKLPEGVFDERELSPLGGFVEGAIREMGVNPVLARDGYDSWLFHKGSSEIRIFVYDGNYLFSTSPINLLPKKEVENVLDYMLSEDFGPLQAGNRRPANLHRLPHPSGRHHGRIGRRNPQKHRRTRTAGRRDGQHARRAFRLRILGIFENRRRGMTLDSERKIRTFLKRSGFFVSASRPGDAQDSRGASPLSGKSPSFRARDSSAGGPCKRSAPTTLRTIRYSF